MGKSTRRWDVVYGQVDLLTRTVVQKFAAQNVTYKAALELKRSHKKICAMKILPAPCPVCNGAGKVENTHGDMLFCIPCDGTGQRNQWER